MSDVPTYGPTDSLTDGYRRHSYRFPINPFTGKEP